jgi:hypothetical protein
MRTEPVTPSSPAHEVVAAFLADLEATGRASRALLRQRRWALREAVLFAAVLRTPGVPRRDAEPEPGGAGPEPGDAEPSGAEQDSTEPSGAEYGGAEHGTDLTEAQRARAEAHSFRVPLSALFADGFVDAWLAGADPVLRGVRESRPATQRARVASLRALGAFAGVGAPTHRYPKPDLRTVLSEPEITAALRALTHRLPGRGPDDHVRLAAVLAVMSVWPARSTPLSLLRVDQLRAHGDDLVLTIEGSRATEGPGEPPAASAPVLHGVAAERVRDWLAVRAGLVGALEGGPVRTLWVSIRSNSRPGERGGALPLPPGMPLKARGLQRAYARSVEAANAVALGQPGFPLPRSLDLLRRSLDQAIRGPSSPPDAATSEPSAPSLSARAEA